MGNLETQWGIRKAIEARNENDTGPDGKGRHTTMRSTTTNWWKQGREGGNWSSHLERPLVFRVDL